MHWNRRPSRRWHFGWLIGSALLFTACGGSHHQVTGLAVVEGRVITQSQVMAYVRYADRYYGAVYGSAAPDNCGRATVNVVCTALAREALSRLIEEQVITSYASHHHITLNEHDHARIRAELASMRASDATIGGLLKSGAVSVPFLHSLLVTETLVSKVETAVTPATTREGYSFHVRTFLFPLSAAGSSAATYRQAERLATDGGPVPVDATSTTRWVARARLVSQEITALQVASNGDFVGPFQDGGNYVVMERLGAGIHRYGRPARAALETRAFRVWLTRQVRRAAPTCTGAHGKTTSCPVA